MDGRTEQPGLSHTQRSEQEVFRQSGVSTCHVSAQCLHLCKWQLAEVGWVCREVPALPGEGVQQVSAAGQAPGPWHGGSVLTGLARMRKVETKA